MLVHISLGVLCLALLVLLLLFGVSEADRERRVASAASTARALAWIDPDRSSEETLALPRIPGVVVDVHPLSRRLSERERLVGAPAYLWAETVGRTGVLPCSTK